MIVGLRSVIDAQFFRPSDRNFAQHEELGLTPEDVSFESGDGTRLFGWFLPTAGEPRGTVIHYHGSDGNLSRTIRHVDWLPQAGFNVFAVDYRGYGRSDGEPSHEGVLDDAVAAIEYVRSRDDVDADRLLLWGQSMGGQLAIRAATEVGPPPVRAVVAEATYASHRHHVRDKIAELGPLWLVQWAGWLLTSDALAADRVAADLGSTALLLVHGTRDAVVRPYHSERLFAAATEPREIWWVEGAGHLDVFGDPAIRGRLVDFFGRVLADRRD